MFGKKNYEDVKPSYIKIIEDKATRLADSLETLKGQVTTLENKVGTLQSDNYNLREVITHLRRDVWDMQNPNLYTCGTKVMLEKEVCTVVSSKIRTDNMHNFSWVYKVTDSKGCLKERLNGYTDGTSTINSMVSGYISEPDGYGLITANHLTKYVEPVTEKKVDKKKGKKKLLTD